MTATTIKLSELATTRSGDKGNHVNIGVVANSEAAYDYLVRELTTERIGQFFSVWKPLESIVTCCQRCGR